MKVLMINGSPHKNGSTFTALTIVGEELKKYGVDYEIMWVGNKPISGCIACSSCKQTGKCFIDDKVNEFMEKGKECDGFVFGSPVYYASATGQITSFMDRLFMVGRQSMKYKPAFAVSCQRRSGATNTYDMLNKYIGISNMIQVPSKYWNMMIGRNPEEVLKDEEGIQIMQNLAKNMAWLIKVLKVAENNGLGTPDRKSVV